MHGDWEDFNPTCFHGNPWDLRKTDEKILDREARIHSVIG